MSLRGVYCCFQRAPSVVQREIFVLFSYGEHRRLFSSWTCVCAAARGMCSFYNGTCAERLSGFRCSGGTEEGGCGHRFYWRSRADVTLKTGQHNSFSLWSSWGAGPAPAPMVKLSPVRVRVLWPDRLELVGAVRGDFRRCGDAVRAARLLTRAASHFCVLFGALLSVGAVFSAAILHSSTK